MADAPPSYSEGSLWLMMIPVDVERACVGGGEKGGQIGGSRGSQSWGYALACDGRRNRGRSECFFFQAGLAAPLTRGAR